MRKKLLSFVLSWVLSFVLLSSGFGLEKVKVSTSVKFVPSYYLPMEAAEEKGFWKENGLEVEWVPFAGTAAQYVAVAAGASNIGLSTWEAPMVAAERGVPVMIVGEALSLTPWSVWVKADSPYRHPRDLKGARIGVPRLGGTSHMFGRIVARAHEIEKDVRFIGAGGMPEVIAGIKAGSLDGLVEPIVITVGLKLEGVIREIASLADYLPRPWKDGIIVFARTDLARSSPDTVRRVIKATLQASDFLSKNPSWAVGNIKKNQRFSGEAAKVVYDAHRFSATGKIDRRWVDNLRTTFIEYGILTEKVPAVDALFSNNYIP